jgi:hypothetical protein
VPQQAEKSKRKSRRNQRSASMKTPNEFLALYSRKYKNVWRLADAVREKRGSAFPDWPPWCFLPITAWTSLLGVRPRDYSKENFLRGADALNLAALGAWRYTQDIYTFHPKVLEALLRTKLPGNIPVNVLLRMPQWCMYIDLSEYTNVKKTLQENEASQQLHGFFVFLEYHNIPELRFLLNMTNPEQNAFLDIGPIVLMGDWSVKEALQKWELGVSQETNSDHSLLFTDEASIKLAMALVSITLYLCSDEPDIAGREAGTLPQYPIPKKTKRGLRLFPPPKPSIWKVGATIGEKMLRAERAHKEQRRQAGEVEPVTRRAHIRNAHWHSYWIGPKKPRPDLPADQQVRELVPRWLYQITVGVDKMRSGSQRR